MGLEEKGLEVPEAERGSPDGPLDDGDVEVAVEEEASVEVAAVGSADWREEVEATGSGSEAT